jgi:methane/ammonia monooxygenase subunit C
LIKKYKKTYKIYFFINSYFIFKIHMIVVMAQMPALIPKEVEIQRLKKIWLIVIAMGSTAASVEVDNFVDGSLHQTSIRDSAFTPAHWWLYSHFVALPLGWGSVAIYDRKVPVLRGPNNSMNTGLKMTILGYLATMFTIGVNEMWHFFCRRDICRSKPLDV